jgi:DNA polymerase elongation subunit (family B)
MNSMYGTLGVKKYGLQPCMPLAALTTGLGRQLIETTKKFFEAKIPGSRVIYGDSVMWLPFPEEAQPLPSGVEGAQTLKELLQRAFLVGKETCEEIKRDVFRQEFADTNIDLEFENIFCPYLLVGKKNYSALVWDDTFGVEKPKKVLNKGFRCVRRDVDAYTRQSQIDVLQKVHDRNVPEAERVAVEKVQKLLRGDVKAADLSLSKKVNSSYV